MAKEKYVVHYRNLQYYLSEGSKKIPFFNKKGSQNTII